MLQTFLIFAAELQRVIEEVLRPDSSTPLRFENKIHVFGRNVPFLKDNLAFISMMRIKVVHSTEAAKQSRLAASRLSDQRRYFEFDDKGRRPGLLVPVFIGSHGILKDGDRQ